MSFYNQLMVYPLIYMPEFYSPNFHMFLFIVIVSFVPHDPIIIVKKFFLFWICFHDLISVTGVKYDNKVFSCYGFGLWERSRENLADLGFSVSNENNVQFHPFTNLYRKTLIRSMVIILRLLILNL